MIKRSIVILISLGYLSPISGNSEYNNSAHALYTAYHGYNRELVEKIIDQGNGSRAEQLEKARDVAVSKPDAATAVLIQEDLIEAQKSWFQRHYRVTTVGIPLLTLIAIGFPFRNMIYISESA